MIIDKSPKQDLTIRETEKLTSSGEAIEKKVHQYINYLHDYSLLNEHTAINVKIWDEIMIWAAVLGQTGVVRRQFRRLYPKYEQETVYGGESVFLTTSFTQSASKGRKSGGIAGGGGSTSSGGGGPLAVEVVEVLGKLTKREN